MLLGVAALALEAFSEPDPEPLYAPGTEMEPHAARAAEPAVTTAAPANNRITPRRVIGPCTNVNPLRTSAICYPTPFVSPGRSH